MLKDPVPGQLRGKKGRSGAAPCYEVQINLEVLEYGSRAAMLIRSLDVGDQLERLCEDCRVCAIFDLSS